MMQNTNITLRSAPVRAIVRLASAASGPGMDFIASALADSAADDPLGNDPLYHEGDFLTVYGTLDFQRQKITAITVSREPMVGTLVASKPGPYRVTLLDQAGQKLAEHAFTPLALADVPNAGVIALTIPYATGTTTITIESDTSKTALASINVSKTAPEVSGVTITPQQTSATSKRLTITWRGRDVDGDALAYTILYSADDKHTWRPLAQGLKDKRYVLDTAALEGTRGKPIGCVRVIAHDGVLTGRADSAGFRIENKPPHPVLMVPQDGGTYGPDQLVTLQAVADDPEDGALPDNALSWTSDRDGLLAKGRLAHVHGLSAGDHVVTLSATDREGKSATRRVLIHIGTQAPPLIVSCEIGEGDGLTLGGHLANGSPWAIKAAAIKSLIKRGRLVYSTDQAGHLAPITVAKRGGKEHLRSVKTKYRTENLLQLPLCR